jgi:hypothetical protein
MYAITAIATTVAKGFHDVLCFSNIDFLYLFCLYVLTLQMRAQTTSCVSIMEVWCGVSYATTLFNLRSVFSSLFCVCN